MKTTMTIAAASAALLFGAGAAPAHVTLDPPEAAVGTTHKAVFRVPHGCAGAATSRLRIRIPEGVIGVKPMPKPGWELEKLHGTYAQPHDLYGTPVSEGVTEVAWSGALPDDEYDEFALLAYLSSDLEPGTTLYFPVVQECQDGSTARWIELPQAGHGAHGHATPAPGLDLTTGR